MIWNLLVFVLYSLFLYFSLSPSSLDDDFDMFGDDDEDAAEDKAAKAKADRAKKAAEAKAAYDLKKSKEKPKVFRSLVTLEVKPWEADTDLHMVFGKIVEYKQDGLVWGTNKEIVPVAYGICKILMTCTIDDDKVLMDDITDSIESLEDYVQSVQVLSMNKL
jgi:elongation factor 1-beta